MGSSQSSSLASVLLRYGVVVIVGMRQGRSNLSLIWSSSLSALSRCGISLRSHCRCHCPLSSEQDEQTLLKVAQEEHVLSTQCSHFGSTILCIASSAWLVVMTSAEAKGCQGAKGWQRKGEMGCQEGERGACDQGKGDRECCRVY